MDGKELTKKFVLMIILFIVGFSFASEIPDFNFGEKLLLGYIFAGTPFGWSTLTRITPNIFIVSPLGGWVFYFILKLTLSWMVGMVVTPFKIFKMIKEYLDYAQESQKKLFAIVAGVVLLAVAVVAVLTMGGKQSVPSKAKVKTETTKPPVSEASKKDSSTTKKKVKTKKQDSATSAPTSLAGTWDGYYINYGRKINFQLNLNQNGSSISGSTYETYEDVSYTANINGDIRGNGINFVKNIEGRGFEPIEYVGTINNNKMRGKWIIKKTGVSGEWNATKRS